jgi:hypothetical protein
MKQDRLKMIEKMLEENPSDSFLNYAAALEFTKNGNVEKAIIILENLILNDSNYLASYYQLAKLYETTEQLHKAEVTYKSGIIVSTQQNNNKTTNELNEALFILNEDALD